MYSSFRSAGQPGVALLPLAARRQPDRERLREILVGMALRVPRIEVQDEALAIGLRRVELRVRLGGRAEHRAALPAQAQAEGVVDGVAGLVAQDAHGPLVLAALDLEHLRLFQPLEPRVRQVEGHGDRRAAVGCEPLVRQVEVQRKAQPHAGDLVAKLGHARGQRAFDGEREIGHLDVQERVVRKACPVSDQRPARHPDDPL